MAVCTKLDVSQSVSGQVVTWANVKLTGNWTLLWPAFMQVRLFLKLASSQYSVLGILIHMREKRVQMST